MDALSRVSEVTILATMRAFTHITIVEDLGQWSAWFRESPQVVSSGVDALNAISRLIELHGWTGFEILEIVSSIDGNLEFLVCKVHTVTRFCSLLVPSTN
jgi:hypothetical protein